MKHVKFVTNLKHANRSSSIYTKFSHKVWDVNVPIKKIFSVSTNLKIRMRVQSQQFTVIETEYGSCQTLSKQ